MEATPPRRFSDALKIPEIRWFIGATGFFSLAGRALLVVIGFQVYQITKSALALGFLGMIEAVPAIFLVFFGGYAADHFNRKKILLITRAVSCLCAFFLVLLSWRYPSGALLGIYTVVFLIGVARGFADPAGTALEAQVVPRPLTVNASSWITSTWITCSVVGPATIGFIFDAFGAVGAYLCILTSYIFAWFCTLFIPAKPLPPPLTKEPILKSMVIGWHFVFKNQPLWTAMALDLFAVLFGGMVALLPIFATDILHVGAKGLGLLNAAPMLGALMITLIATKHAPIAKAGRNLLWTVGGFGVSVLFFAFSKNFWFSMTALFFSGVFDGISVVIRRSMVRLLSPDHLRGRIAAANWVFICASNELGAFESGMLAAWIGAVPCVIFGGVATLAIVGTAALAAGELRRLRFDPKTLERLT